MTREIPAIDLPDRTILLDGGMGQELRRRTNAADHPLWSAQVMIDDPGAVRGLHADYIAAGADIIITNTYSTIRRKLAENGAEDRFVELNRLGAAIAREAVEAAGRPALVAGSLPPLHGSYRPDQVRPFREIEPLYREQAEILAPQVDLFICETMSSGEEARAAVSGAASTGLPVWVAWTLSDDAPPRLRSDETLTTAFAALEGLPVSAFLANCCAPESVTAAMAELAGLSEFPAGGYANGFEAIPAGWEIAKGVAHLGSRKDLDPDSYAVHVRHWIERGARIVGGCCEVGPGHIDRLRQMLAAA